MKYQLFIYKAFDGSDRQLVATSDVIEGEERVSWYNSVKGLIPESFTSTVVDETHAWFLAQTAEVVEDKGPSIEDIQKQVDSYSGEVVPGELISQLAKLRMLAEISEKYEYEQRLNAHMASFEG